MSRPSSKRSGNDSASANSPGALAREQSPAVDWGKDRDSGGLPEHGGLPKAPGVPESIPTGQAFELSVGRAIDEWYAANVPGREAPVRLAAAKPVTSRKVTQGRSIDAHLRSAKPVAKPANGREPARQECRNEREARQAASESQRRDADKRREPLAAADAKSIQPVRTRRASRLEVIPESALSPKEREAMLKSGYSMSQASTGPVALDSAERLEWEILPRSVIAKVLRDPNRWASSFGNEKAKRETFDPKRISFLASLNPIRWHMGSQLGKSEYLVAEFEGIAIAESPTFGNAIFYAYSREVDWKRVFSLPKKIALQRGAFRMVHTDDIQTRIRGLLSAARHRRRGGSK